MSQLKLFGGKSRRTTTRSASSGRTAAKNPKKRSSALKRITITLLVLAVLECLYFFCVYTDNAFVSKWRTLYISTAMSTMNHQWLATAFIPPVIINEVLQEMEDARASQNDKVTDSWDAEDPAPSQKEDVPPGMEGMDQGQIDFYTLFHQLDMASTEDYLASHPDALAGGYAKININESGLQDKGTSIRTTQGDEVLAIDAANEVLLIRVADSGYRGVLAIAKDPSRLSVQNSAMLGSAGQTAGTIAQNNGGILSMTGSGFIDNDGKGNGGILAGYAMSDGKATGSHYGYGYKRLELREDNRIYVVNAQDPVNSATRDAVEFQPALIVNGEISVEGFTAWNGIQPRAAIGQTTRGEILMLCIEGRFIDSLGTDVEQCAGILKDYNAKEAMNLDGGTSAIMWYDGQVVTRCSNTAIPQGRTLPNAFVYAGN